MVDLAHNNVALVLVLICLYVFANHYGEYKTYAYGIMVLIVVYVIYIKYRESTGVYDGGTESTEVLRV